MGVVYKATDTLLDKIVALKVLTKRVSDQAALRFQAEAKAAGKLNHPNIVKILDFGISEEGEPYMVQEFVEGTNLAELLQPNGLEIEHALGLFDQICSGLAHAHDSGIIHRDVKPSNVIVTKTDDQPLAKLTDFGIAKLVEVNQNLTSTGAMVGSPLYMSPEQTRGDAIDARSDIYSFGCLMYETLSGRPPLKGDTSMETARMCLSVVPPALSAVAERSIPSDLDNLVAKCLEKEPSRRYQSINELAEALHSLPEVETESAIADSNRPGGTGINKIAIAIAVVSIIGVGGFYAYSANQPPVADQTIPTEIKDPATVENVTSMMAEIAREHNTDVRENTFQPKNPNEIRIVNVTPDTLNQLADRYPNLHTLELHAGKNFDGRNLKALTSLPHLTYLKLSELPLKDSAIGELASLKQLTRLKFDFITSLDGSGLSVLSQMKLHEISYTYCMLNESVISNIAKTKAEVLSFKGSSGATATSLAPLRNMPSLRILAIENMNLVDSALVPLKGLRLTVFRIGENSRLTPKSFEIIRSMKGLQEVGFNGCPSIPVQDRVRLGKELKLVYNTTLEHLFTRDFDEQKRRELDLHP